MENNQTLECNRPDLHLHKINNKLVLVGNIVLKNYKSYKSLKINHSKEITKEEYKDYHNQILPEALIGFYNSLNDIKISNFILKGSFTVGKQYREDLKEHHLDKISNNRDKKTKNFAGEDRKLQNQAKDLAELSIKIEDSNMTNLLLENIDFILFKITGFETDFLQIQNTTFKKDSKLHFKNLNIKNFTLSNITQEWTEAIFEDITVTGKLTLENIDLQKAKFVDCDFSKCDIEIANSVSFKDTLFNSLKWGDDFSEPRFKAKIDIFRQLKFSNDSQGNIIQANNFYSEEMRRYEKEDKSFSDEVIFKFNKYISNFGQNYFLPIFWFFIATIISLLFIYELKDLNVKISVEENFYNELYILIGIIVITFVIRLNFIIIDYLFFLLGLIFLHLYHFYDLQYSFILNMKLSFNIFAMFINPKINEVFKGYEFLWFFHKAILSILIYHLTISLRRQTKR